MMRRALLALCGCALLGAGAAPRKGQRKPALCRQVKTKADLPVPPPGRFAVSAFEPIARHAFHGARAPAHRLQLTIAGRLTPLVAPARRGDAQALAARVGDALAVLPPAARDLVKRVEINPVPNPEDAWWTKKYGARVVAGMTADSDGVLRIYPRGVAQARPVFIRNVMHEVGHMWSNRAYGSRRGEGWTAWRRAIASDPAVPSLYATVAVTEDAAEATALYLSTAGTKEHEKYRAQLPARFALLARALPIHARPASQRALPR